LTVAKDNLAASRATIPAPECPQLTLHDQSRRCEFLVAVRCITDIAGPADGFTSVASDLSLPSGTVLSGSTKQTTAAASVHYLFRRRRERQIESVQHHRDREIESNEANQCAVTGSDRKRYFAG